MASNVGAQKARAMKSGSGAFDVDEFLSKLVNFLKDRKGPEGAFSEDSDGEDYGGHIVPLDWDRIGRKAMAKSRRVPMMGFMSASSPFLSPINLYPIRLGPLSIEQKKRNQGKRAKLEKNKEDERKPQELKEEDIARSQNETTKNVATVCRLFPKILCTV